MHSQGADPCHAAVAAVLQTYLDGLHHSDTGRLRQVFHPLAHYVTATPGAAEGEPPLHLTMAEYFPIVDARPSPASRGEPRNDRIVSIEFAGPVTAFARVECSIGARFFTDLLALILVGGRWPIIDRKSTRL